MKITRIPNFSGHKQGLLGHGHVHLLMAPFTRNCYRTQNLQSLNYLLFVPLQQTCANSWYKLKVTSLPSWSYHPFLSSGPLLSKSFPSMLRCTFPVFSWVALGILKVTANTCNLMSTWTQCGNPDCANKPERINPTSEKRFYTDLYSVLVQLP